MAAPNPTIIIRISVDGVVQGDFYYDPVKLTFMDMTRTLTASLANSPTEILVGLDALQPGETFRFGGGAQPTFEYYRVAHDKCFLHQDRDATRALNIPCAPSGKLWVCQECFEADPGSELRKQLFDKYLRSHESAVNTRRQQNESNRGRFN